jgi:hypothetical protein
MTPSIKPSTKPSAVPSSQPTRSIAPSQIPTIEPSSSKSPTVRPTFNVPASALVEAYYKVREDLDYYLDLHNDNFTKSNLYGIAVRLPFHDAAEIDIRTTDLMGPDGCLSSSADNSGLVEDTSLVNTVINAMYWANYSSIMSMADFWVLFGTHAIEKSSGDKVKIPFYYGRTDNTECSAGLGRLPSAQAVTSISDVFVTQIGLNLLETGINTIFRPNLNNLKINNILLFLQQLY